MVSKVAVIALVAIVACPILLGYAMNLDETTKTGYKYSGDSTNLTDYLINGSTGSAYTYAHGDSVTMNTVFNTAGSYTRLPEYENITTQAASYELFQSEFTNQTFSSYSIDISLDRFFYIEFTTMNVNVSFYKTVGGNDVLISTTNNVYCAYIQHLPSNSCRIAYDYGSNNIKYSTINDNVSKIVLNGGPASGYYSYRYVSASPAPPNDHYVDISSGFYWTKTPSYYDHPEQWPNLKLPDSTKEFTITMDLNSITDSTYALHINLAPNPLREITLPYTNLPMELSKTTTDGVAKWTLRNENDATEPVTELYTDPTMSSNTYQFTISADSKYDETSEKYYLVINVKASYVGDWPTLMGIANPYMVYDLEYVIRDDPNYVFNSSISSDDLLYYYLSMTADNGARTPTMRMDDALFRAFEYQTITDRSFMPTSFKTNPGITLSKIKLYGSSITFGGLTYSVNDAAINVNGKNVKLDGIVFNTVSNEYGTYDNKINGVLISTTASDPGMTFGGSWIASVAVQSMESYTYTATEWKPGQFGWNGIDTNFLIVGLLTSLGAFIALGIYIRRTKASLWPLLIVCGGAAMLFFIMI